MSNQTQRLVTFTIMDCINCGVAFGLSNEYIARRRDDHANFRCPNGHPQHYPGDNKEERLERENAALRSTKTHLHEQLVETRRSRDAYKGHTTRIRNRVSKGVCPCCNRTFADLARHMKSKHPKYTETP